MPQSSSNRREADPAHDTLVRRLTEILIKLNRGEALDPKALAEEFGVDRRTIQRDLRERFASIGLQKTGGRYRLDTAEVGRLHTADIAAFAQLAGTGRLFPSLSHRAVLNLLRGNQSESLLVRGPDFEDISHREADFSFLQSAIGLKRSVAFQYTPAAPLAGTKAFSGVRPYKLLNQDGVWYLAAEHKQKIKTFWFSGMRAMQCDGGDFIADAALVKQVAQQQSVWQSDRSTTVSIEVSAKAAPYFERRALFAGQQIVDRRADGSLVLTVEAGHPQQVLPKVRHWIPHLRIQHPVAWQEELDEGLKAYCAAVKTT